MIATTIKRLALGALLASATAVSAFAAETTLIISSWAPPTHGINAMAWPKLISMIEEATEGRVTAEIKYQLAPPPAQFDLVQDGAADLTWIFHGYNPGRFVATKLIELPGYEGNAEAASVAYQRAHEKFFAAADEHRGVKLVALHTHGVGVLHSDRKVTSLDEISGMKLRLGGGVSNDVGQALGATAINVPAPKVYETLASHAADGVMMPMEGKASFKLYEVAKNTFTVPGGFYRGSFAVIMNQEKFDSLSEADQKALDAIFGEKTAAEFGKVWDAIDKIGEKAAMDTEGATITAASEADTAKWAELTGPIISKVVDEVSAKGIDAKAAMEFIANEMKNM
ncbi:MAG: TRAP transporter substrate-binding protein [Rhizobiaceae bacterium]